jgi:hypothetical protein
MIKFNEVTWYSKLAAIIFFIGILPILTFYIGTKFQEAKKITELSVENNVIHSTSPKAILSEQQPASCFSFTQSPKIETGDLVQLPIECAFTIGTGFFDWHFKIDQIDDTDAQLAISNGTSIVQKIDIQNYQSEFPAVMTENSMGDAQFNIADDYNFDGYKDIRVISDMGASNIFYDYWMFNSKTGKFEKDAVLTDIVNPVFKNRTIIGTTLRGANEYTVATYEFQNGKYVLIKQETFKNN